MTDPPDDICPRPQKPPRQPTHPHAPPIYPATVYQCDDPEQAAALLAGTAPGYVYRRDGHPNADLLADKCRQLHGAGRAAVTASGMAALALAVLSQLRSGEHLVASGQMYGRSLSLLTEETGRLGIAGTVVDTGDHQAVAAACRPNTRLVAVETITNPLLRVSDIGALAGVAHDHGARLLVDNTFASPVVCRPLEHGADLVVESVTKIINGHSDVLLGLLCGGEEVWQRVPVVMSAWGFTSAPFDAWLAARGLGTLHLRVERACANALAAAEFLATRDEVQQVFYPGLPGHPDHQLARRQFGERFGSIVTFQLAGGTAAAERFIAAAAGKVPFCPSLGELATTLSHPDSTSHRGLSPRQREALGITGGTIRLSVGIQSRQYVLAALEEALAEV